MVLSKMMTGILSLLLCVATVLFAQFLTGGCLRGREFKAHVVPLGPFDSVSPVKDSQNLLRAAEILEGDPGFLGPESIAFDNDGNGPYASLADGRVVRRTPQGSWVTVAVTSAAWSHSLCSRHHQEMEGGKLSSTNEMSRVRALFTAEHVCGRPLGLRFDEGTGDLYIADAYFGILSVQRGDLQGVKKGSREENRDRECLGDESDGVSPHVAELVSDFIPDSAVRFFNDVDVLPAKASTPPGIHAGERMDAHRRGKARGKGENGGEWEGSEGGGRDRTSVSGPTIYFTHTSSKYQRRDFLLGTLEGRPDGKLLSHDVRTGVTSVLIEGLVFPNGVALSADRTFLAFCESTAMRCCKYWLKGLQAGTAELLAHIPGFPDNIRLNPRGRFWVAVHKRRSVLIDILAQWPWLRTLLLRLIPDVDLVQYLSGKRHHGMALEIDSNGTVTSVLEDYGGHVVKGASEVTEHQGRLYFGSVTNGHIRYLAYS